MAQEIADSKLLDTWGSSGTKIEPDITKIIEGWQLGEQPPHEYMNWLQNTFGSKLNHILKNGVASWNNETEYLAGSSVQHSGNVWLCETTNTNSEPTGLNANWEKVAINKDLTVTVDTLADLRNISYPANTVWASGYDTKNDGAFGSHIFRLKGVKTTETDNGGTVIIATIGGADYVYELQYDGAVNVKWFGAKGDGVTDDTVAIENALNTKKSIYAPEGIYVTTRTLFPWKQNITGCSQEKTIFKASGDFHIFQILRENGWALDRKSVIFSNFSVYGGGASNNSYAFLAYGVDGNVSSPSYSIGLTIQDVYLELIGGGIYVSDFFRFNVFRVGMSGVTNPLRVAGSVVQSTFDRIINNFDTNMPSTLENIGFIFEQKSYLTSGVQGSENCTLINSSCALNHIGLKITGASLLFKAQNLDLDFVRDYGIYCNNGFMTFENIWIAIQNPTTKSRGLYVGVQSAIESGLAVFKQLRIQAYSVHSTSNAIEIGDGINFCNGVSIEKSIIDSAGSATWNYGIFLNKVDNVSVNENKIKSTSISSDYAIFGTATNSTIIRNVSPSKKIKVKPAAITLPLEISENNVADGNGESTRYVSNARDYVTTSGTHTVVIDNLYDTLGGSYTKALIELTLVGVAGSDAIVSKYYAVATGLGTWTLGTPVKIYGNDITITLSSSTSTSITLTVSSAASISSLSVYAQITAMGDGILILK